MLVYTAQKKCSCKFCSLAFSVNSTLWNHMLTHSGEKLFSCDVFPSVFSKNANLKRQMQTHNGEKTYENTHSSETIFL